MIMSIPIFVFFSAGNRDMHAVGFLFLPNFSLIKMGRFFWLQFPHMLRRETGRMRGKEKHFASAGTNSEGGKLARTRSKIPPLACLPGCFFPHEVITGKQTLAAGEDILRSGLQSDSIFLAQGSAKHSH